MRSRTVGIGLLAALLAGLPGIVAAKCEDPPAPKVDWQQCNKRDADLRDKDLQGANLQGALLAGAKLGQANLRGANLNKASLLGADLSPTVDFREATLSEAQLKDDV
jgi:uncharacterized protein YjbI with pentapeptide repeats